MLLHCDLVIGIDVGETNGNSVCILVDIWMNVFSKHPTAERDLWKGNCRSPILGKVGRLIRNPIVEGPLWPHDCGN